MCTAITFCPDDHYFGRTLDLERGYHEEITVTPRRFPFSFRKVNPLASHHAIIGMATVAEGYPLYYEAVNEKGLGLAGLNFPGNAVYFPPAENRDNVAPFELIPWILGQCATVREAVVLLKRLNLTDIPFSEEYPLSPLHWLLADRTESLVIESAKQGLQLYTDPVGVLTNNPPFDFHLHHLSHYIQCSKEPPVNRFAQDLPLAPYSLGMGGMGLPGDLSSPSRFVRAAFTKWNVQSGETEETNVRQFFHILGAVSQPKGCTRLPDGQYEYTRYTSCCNTDRGIYYYTTYENPQITAVELHKTALDGDTLVTYPLRTDMVIRREN